jgi:voltage-gated potassium channel
MNEDNRSVAETPDPSRAALRLQRRSLTARGAVRFIAAFTLLATVGGGLLGWLLDREDFPTIGTALWWALQTVTTVGYGDVTPKNTEGRVIAAVVMLAGIAFLAVVTAAVTASLVEDARRRLAKSSGGDVARELEHIGARLSAIESLLHQSDAPVPHADPETPAPAREARRRGKRS